jgi:hypothetical protein
MQNLLAALDALLAACKCMEYNLAIGLYCFTRQDWNSSRPFWGACMLA